VEGWASSGRDGVHHVGERLRPADVPPEQPVVPHAVLAGQAQAIGRDWTPLLVHRTGELEIWSHAPHRVLPGRDPVGPEGLVAVWLRRGTNLAR
jgi:hypothetical protein